MTIGQSQAPRRGPLKRRGGPRRGAAVGRTKRQDGTIPDTRTARRAPTPRRAAGRPACVDSSSDPSTAVRTHTTQTSGVTAALVCRAVALLVICGCATASRDVMTWTEYASLQRSGRHPEWPYILQRNTQRGALLYFGAAHTFDPAHDQIRRIEQEWHRFRPDIAFTEGGSPPIATSRDAAVRSAGEPGLVRFLAARDNVPTTTLDPSRAQEVAVLSRTFTREQVKLFFVLRGVSQYRERAGLDGLESETDRILRLFENTPGLSGGPRTIEELQTVYRRHFPDADGYQDVPRAWFDPVVTATFLNNISRADSDFRDDYMVRLLAQHVSQGLRVFAVVGGSHVVMQERALLAKIRGLR